MLTSYMMKCPHAGCNWFGNLIPRINQELYHGQAGRKASIVEFRCPRCQTAWKARMVGDDVKPLPAETATPVN
jgi:hypothetical protein